MSLDELIQPTSVEAEKTDHESSLAELFGRSALYELHQAAFGLAQTVGLQEHVGEMAQPKEADSFWGQQSQMIGRGAGSFLPTVAVALTTRSAFGKFLAEGGVASENALLKRSSLGFTTAEAAATGLISGALFKPTEAEKAQDWSSLALDRASGGGAGALSFAAFNLSSFGWNKVADSALVAKFGAERLLKSSVVSGMVSGLPGGLANVEASSLFSEGKLTVDRDKIGQSMYEMVVVGGLLGGTTSLLGRIGSGRRAGATEKQLVEGAFSAEPADLAAERQQSEKSAQAVYGMHENYERGAGDERLNQWYGAASDTVRALQQIEMHAHLMNLKNLADFIESAPETRVELVQRVVSMNRYDYYKVSLLPDNLEGLEKLESRFGRDTKEMNYLVTAGLEFGFGWGGLGKFVEEAPESRQALVHKLIHKGAEASELDGDRLRGLEFLHKVYGADSPLVDTIVRAEREGTGVVLAHIQQFIEKSPDAHSELLRQLVEDGDINLLSRQGLFGLVRLNEIFGEESITAQKLKTLAQRSSVVDLGKLAQFVDEKPASRKAFLEKLVIDHSSADAFWTDRVRGLESLQNIYGESSPELKQILQVERGTGMSALGELARFIEAAPATRKDLVASVVRSESGLPFLRTNRLEALETLNETFGAGSKTVKELLAVEHTAGSPGLSEVASFVKLGPESRQALVEKAIAAGGDSSRLSKSWLESMEQLERECGSDSPVTRALFGIAKASDLSAVAKALAREPEVVKGLLKDMAEAGGSVATLNKDNVEDYVDLSRMLSGDAALSKQILTRAGGGFNPYAVTTFLRCSSDNLQFLKAITDLNADSKYFDELPSLKVLSEHFPGEPEVIKQAIAMNEKGLRLNWLDVAIQEDPMQNTELVRQLLRQPNVNISWDSLDTLISYVNTAKLTAYFGDGSNFKTVMAEAGSDWHTSEVTSRLLQFMAADPVSHPAIVLRVVASGAEARAFTKWQLRGAEELYRQVGSDGDLFERILRLNNDDLSSLAKFVAADLVANKALFAKVVADDAARAGHLDIWRLMGLSALNKEFGEDSKTMQSLRKLEEHGAQLCEIAHFLELDPANKALIEKLVSDDAPVGFFQDNQLAGRKALNAIFGGDSGIMQRLSGYSPALLDLSQLAGFIEGLQVKEQSARAEGAVARKQLVEKLLTDESPASAMSAPRLQALLELNDLFGENSTTMRRILAAENKGDAALKEVRRLERTMIGHSLLVGLGESSDPQATLTMEKLSNVGTLENLIQPDESMAQRIAALVQEGLNPDALVSYLTSDGSEHKLEVRRMIQDGATAAQLSWDRLHALYVLKDIYREQPEVLSGLIRLEPDGLRLPTLLNFINHNISPRERLVSKLVKEGATAKQLSHDRLVGLEWAQGQFHDSNVLNRLLALENEGVLLKDLSDFYFSFTFTDRQTVKHFIETMIAEDQPAERFSLKQVMNSWAASNTFAVDSPAATRLLELGERGLDLVAFRNLVRSLQDSKSAAVAKMVLEGASERELDPGRLAAFFRTKKAFEGDPEVHARILELEKQGLSLADTIRFISEDPSHRQLFVDSLKNGYDARRLGVVNLRDIKSVEALASKFDPQLEATSYLRQLQEQHLSGTRLAEYVQERPEQRLPIVAELIKEKADVSRFVDQMRLSAFPEPVAGQLADRARLDGMSVAEIIGHLRDWRSGRYFRSLIIDQVESGRPITAAALNDLRVQARGLAAESKAAVTLREDSGPTSVQTRQLADTLRITAERIASVVPKDKPVVLLGRDTWPLLPFVRTKGRDVQYFLWSRTNGSDPRTYDQWFKEVPPGAFVIDTGYKGSVIDTIRAQDQTVSGLLMSKSSSSRYEQLLQQSDHSQRTGALEALIKYTPRSRSYTDRGGALVAELEEDKDTPIAKKSVGFDGVSRWAAESQVRSVLRAAGLPEWDVWRYGMFVGLTPQERLGLNSAAEVEEHYRKVGERRRAKPSDCPIEPAQALAL